MKGIQKKKILTRFECAFAIIVMPLITELDPLLFFPLVVPLVPFDIADDLVAVLVPFIMLDGELLPDNVDGEQDRFRW